MAKKVTWNPGGGMTSETTPDNVQESEHKCLYGNKVNEMHKILSGNGEPSKGMVAQMILVQTRQDEVIKNLGFITGKTDGLLSEITEVHSKIILLKGELTGKEAAEEKQRSKDAVEATRIRDRNWRIAQIVGIMLTAIGLYIGYNKIHTTQGEIKDETQITNEILAPPGVTRGSSIIIIPVNDTTKIKEDLR